MLWAVGSQWMCSAQQHEATCCAVTGINHQLELTTWFTEPEVRPLCSKNLFWTMHGLLRECVLVIKSLVKCRYLSDQVRVSGNALTTGDSNWDTRLETHSTSPQMRPWSSLRQFDHAPTHRTARSGNMTH